MNIGIECVNSRLEQGEERISNLNTDHLKSYSWKRKKIKNGKRSKGFMGHDQET